MKAKTKARAIIDDKILSGIDDVPAIADDKCCRCETLLTHENFDGWFVFVKVGGQMYNLPICKVCDKKESTGGGEVVE
jgi:hypothetical protein